MKVGAPIADVFSFNVGSQRNRGHLRENPVLERTIQLMCYPSQGSDPASDTIIFWLSTASFERVGVICICNLHARLEIFGSY